jgi:hypothetical protein
LFGDFTDIQITEQGCALFIKEDVRTFYISVENLQVVEAGKGLE